jgi:hypothetical protein
MPTAVYVLVPKQEGLRKKRETTTATPPSGITDRTRHIDRCIAVIVPNRVASELISEKICMIIEPHFRYGSSGGWGGCRDVSREQSLGASSRG